MSAISTCLRKYATFSGRATRHEFWMFYLFMNIVLYVPLLIGLSLLTDDSTAGAGIFFIVISIIFDDWISDSPFGGLRSSSP